MNKWAVKKVIEPSEEAEKNSYLYWRSQLESENTFLSTLRSVRIFEDRSIYYHPSTISAEECFGDTDESCLGKRSPYFEEIAKPGFYLAHIGVGILSAIVPPKKPEEFELPSRSEPPLIQIDRIPNIQQSVVDEEDQKQNYSHPSFTNSEFKPDRLPFLDGVTQLNAQKATPNTMKMDIDLKTQDSDGHYMKKLMVKSFSDLNKNDSQGLLSSLLDLLDKKEFTIDQISKINDEEFILFKSLANKMYGPIIEQSVTLESFVNTINSNIKKGKTKRFEEKLKLVFKKSMKHIFENTKEKIDVNASKKSNKAAYVKEFFNYYFESTYNEEPDFREFFKVKDQKGNLNQKKLNSELVHPLTVNRKFILTVCLSKRFKKDILYFIENHFIEVYKETRIAKLKRILIHFYDLLNKWNDPIKIEEFINNQQTKLPWSTSDLTDAIQIFTDIINSK